MRAGYLDGLRGLAVIWMVIFHTAYDMRLLGFNDWNFGSGFWFGFPRVIAFTFLFCVGISLTFTHRPKISWKKLNKRLLKLGFAALCISLGTYIFNPDQWIYFGTLHCIFLGSLLGALLVNHLRIVWALFLLIFTLQYGLNFDIKWVSSILEKPSMDFIPIYPWFWAILIGIIAAPYFSKSHFLMSMHPPKFLKLLGQHSLKIYLIHQPIIFGVLYLVKRSFS